jgi:FixJ family two-component response regulator
MKSHVSTVYVVDDDIQDRTVDVHRFNIMRKVGVRTLAELLHLWTVAHQPGQG